MLLPVNGNILVMGFVTFRLLESHNIVLGEVLKTEPYCSHIWNKIHDNKTLVTRIGELGTSAQVLFFYKYRYTADKRTLSYFHSCHPFVRMHSLLYCFTPSSSV